MERSSYGISGCHRNAGIRKTKHELFVGIGRIIPFYPGSDGCNPHL